VIAYIDPSGVLHSVDGVLRGSIELAPRGRYGFGYDPIFIVEGTGKALAEFPPEEKNRISHRSHALAKIRPIIVKTIG
jgi:XTP/dITP diphosphohydrolase